jgi:hypothetical protein
LAGLNDVLGAILRDVAQARVTSDLFSRSVSFEYRDDEVLRGFPVPRVEVVQASLELKFAVNDVERKEVNREAFLRARATAYAAELGRQLYSDFIETNPRGDELVAIISEKGLALETQLPAVIERTISGNLDDLETAMEQQRPDRLVRKIQGEVAGLILADDDVKDVLTRGTLVSDIRERVSVASATVVEALAREAVRIRGPEGELDVGRLPLAEYGARLSERVYSDLVLASPRRAELEKTAAEEGVRLDRELRAAAQRVLTEDPEALRVALQEDPDALVERLESEVASTVLGVDPVKRVLTRRTRVTDIRTQVATAVTGSLVSFARDVRAALEAAERQALTVDVAVTNDDLAEVPETKVSQISVVSQIRNYEWVPTGEEGAPARLQPE